MRFFGSKRKIPFFLLICLLSGIMYGCGTEEKDNKFTVYTSFYAMYDFTRSVAEGADIEIVNLVPAGVEPHEWEPSTKTIRELSGADAFIYNGCGMEGWADDIIASAGGIRSLNASEGIEDASASDPHIWLNPLNAMAEYEAICEFLSSADDANADIYKANTEKIKKELEQLDGEYSSRLATLPGKDIIVSHGAYGYLCKRYGLAQTELDGIQGSSDPSLSKMAQTVQLARDKGIKYVFYALGESDKTAAALAGEIGGEVLPLSAFEYDADNRDYITVMRENLENLTKALE